ncbi:hypothetical protein OS493_029039 [Desmophyllum pertusum]|uniref:Uncharacterized protein n=1 Tax=Desmophyllum pertusum TaxID=174260 RepID=A0A9W9YK41_9CNID|nr:hypothetical protein OS493_029039 [Desmophyllum pertusum]
MDKYSVDATLQNLRAAEAAALRQGDSQAAKRLLRCLIVKKTKGHMVTKVVQTEENDDGEELQSNSDQDNNEALKNRHQRQHKKMEGERCSDKNKDANGSEGEGESKGESEEEESEDESISKGISEEYTIGPKRMQKTVASRLQLRKQYTFSSKETASAGNRKPRKTESNSKPDNRKKPCQRKIKGSYEPAQNVIDINDIH